MAKKPATKKPATKKPATKKPAGKPVVPDIVAPTRAKPEMAGYTVSRQTNGWIITTPNGMTIFNPSGPYLPDGRRVGPKQKEKGA